MTLLLILWSESQPAFRLLWLRRWFRVVFWVLAFVAIGGSASSVQR